MNNDIVDLIVKQLAEVHRPSSSDIGDENPADTTLYGKNGLLDSVGLVTLIVAVEQAVEDQFNKIISLADERAMSQKSSPFRTIGSLAEYVNQLIYRSFSVWYLSASLVEMV